MVAYAYSNRFLSLILVDGSWYLSLQKQKVDVLFKTSKKYHALV
jgi:hypothetical protein